MPHRTFTDSVGRAWDVWFVQPEHVERRRGAGEASTPKVERRGRREFRAPLEGKWVDGWLCFETRGEKRRLAPVPPDWMELPIGTLEQLCRSAAEARRSRRLIE